MSFDKQSDVKNHLSHRTRSQIHLIEPANQSYSEGVSGVEQPPAESPEGNPVDSAPKQRSASDFEADRNYRSTDSSNLAQATTSKSVQE
jgi:hypothetical protein